MNTQISQGKLQGVPKKWHPCQLRQYTSYELKNTRYLHRLNNFNIHYYWFIELRAQCVHPAAVQPEYKTTTPFFNAAVNEALW